MPLSGFAAASGSNAVMLADAWVRPGDDSRQCRLAEKKGLPGWGLFDASREPQPRGDKEREKNPAREPTSSRLRVHATRIHIYTTFHS